MAKQLIMKLKIRNTHCATYKSFLLQWLASAKQNFSLLEDNEMTVKQHSSQYARII